jgi:hypothetical protein
MLDKRLILSRFGFLNKNCRVTTIEEIDLNICPQFLGNFWDIIKGTISFEHIFLIDRYGNKIAVIRPDQTIAEGIDALYPDEKSELVCVVSVERKMFAFVK